MNRLIKTAATAAITAIGLIGTAAGASAYTVNNDGSLHVTKGEVQSAFKWNNGDFDKKAGELQFSANSTSTQSNHFEGICGGTTYTGDLVTTITRTTEATPTRSANGKQINGWDLTAGAIKSSSTDYAHSTLNRAMNEYKMCTLLGGTDGGSAFSLVKGDAATGTVQVTSGTDTRVLPLTPVEVPAP